MNVFETTMRAAGGGRGHWRRNVGRLFGVEMDGKTWDAEVGWERRR